ncbi:hypothetical protein, partial [Streptomyces anulatus]|uniref:hypothetical protein n=1 Tax=Streptomyces anulatus TaxID=1892 RepID=UPI003864153F
IHALARMEGTEFASRILKALHAFYKPLRGLCGIHALRELNYRCAVILCASPLRFVAGRPLRSRPAGFAGLAAARVAVHQLFLRVGSRTGGHHLPGPALLSPPHLGVELEG